VAADLAHPNILAWRPWLLALLHTGHMVYCDRCRETCFAAESDRFIL